MTGDSGDLEIVKDAVAAQIHALQDGDFTDDMMQKAVLYNAFQTAETSDTISGLAAQRLLQMRRGDQRSLNEIADAMRKVTREEISEAAKQLALDTVFVLRAEQEEVGADDI